MMISHGSFCLRQLWEKPYRALTYTSFWVKCGWKVMTWIHFLTVEKNSHSSKGKNFSHAFFIIFLEFYLVDFWSSRCWRHRRPESEISDCFSFKHRQENQSEWVGCSAEPIQAASFHMTLEKKTQFIIPPPSFPSHPQWVHYPSARLLSPCSAVTQGAHNRRTSGADCFVCSKIWSCTS